MTEYALCPKNSNRIENIASYDQAPLPKTILDTNWAHLTKTHTIKPLTNIPTQDLKQYEQKIYRQSTHKTATTTTTQYAHT